jgi:hypothetical protein
LSPSAGAGKRRPYKRSRHGDIRIGASPPVIARSGATKQSSWIAAVGFASLAMTNGKVHQIPTHAAKRLLHVSE